jgi:hypothetical protein
MGLMPGGLQIWDAGAVNMVDTNTGLTFLGIYTIPLNTNSGSITVPEFGIAGVVPWYYLVRPYSVSESVRNLALSHSGTSLNWTAGGQRGDNPTTVNGYILYGIR